MTISRSRAHMVLALVLLAGSLLARPLSLRVHTAGNAAITAGEFVVEPPTLINLGFEWFIDGDDNRNASVDVSYRKTGDTQVAAGAAAAAPAGRAHQAGTSSST